MTRSPLFYPLNRGMDAEAGGIADLQTDVMRFMAILSLCLVAIFALVQSIPLLPTEPPEIQTQAPQPDVTTAAEPEAALRTAEPKIIDKPLTPPTVEEEQLVITRPAPRRLQRSQVRQLIIEQTIVPEPSVSEAPIEPMAVQEPVPEPPPQESAPVSEPQGFTLRFETDLALTRLVARNEVGLYAITPEKSVRMNVNRGQMSFWAASVPNQFHEMDETTVPDDVLSALRRASSVKASDVKWGVTLPSNMRQQLDQYLHESEGGALIIGGDGNLRLEQ